MLNNEELVNEVASYKGDTKKRFDAALAALLALAWTYRDQIGENFSFSANPVLYEQALAICREMSDRCSEDAHKRLIRLVEDSLDYADEDVAWEQTGDGIESFDMAGSHLLELLAVWIGVAIQNSWTQNYTKVMISRYLANPFLCPEWKEIPLDTLAWGKGYARNILEQLTLIGQGLIIGGGRYAECVDEQAKGATYYIRRRGSNYDCDVCEGLANVPIPIEVPFEYSHARCMCYPEFHYEPMPL